MDIQEIARLQKYMQQKFGNQNIHIVKRKGADDSAEVLMGDEFIGVVYKDTEDGEISYDFNMAILDIDLPTAA